MSTMSRPSATAGIDRCPTDRRIAGRAADHDIGSRLDRPVEPPVAEGRRGRSGSASAQRAPPARPEAIIREGSRDDPVRELTKVAQRGPDLRFERGHLVVVGPPWSRRTRAGARSRGRSRRPIAAAAIRRGDRVPAAAARPPQPPRSGRASSAVRGGGPGSGRAGARSRAPAGPLDGVGDAVAVVRPDRPGGPAPRPGRHRGERGSWRASDRTVARSRATGRIDAAARHRAGTGPRGSGHRALGRAPTPARRPPGRPPARGRGAPLAVGSGAVAPNRRLRRLRSPTSASAATDQRARSTGSFESRPRGIEYKPCEAGRDQGDGRRRLHRRRAATLAGDDARASPRTMSATAPTTQIAWSPKPRRVAPATSPGSLASGEQIVRAL